MFNKNINTTLESNYYTKPLNEPQFVNPFLQKSEVEALNEILKNPDLLARLNPSLLSQTLEGLNPVAERGVQLPGLRAAPLGDVTGLNPVPQSNTISDEELTSIVQNEVYRLPDNRRDIVGFTRLTEDQFPLLDNETITTYVRNTSGRRLGTGSGPTILLGIAGSQWRNFIRDGIIDGSLFLHFDYIKNTIYFRNRFDAVENAYNRIKELYPDSNIIIGGHSLATALGQELLNNHKDDPNIFLNGYNGLRDPNFDDSTDKRFKGHRIEKDVVSGVHDIFRDEKTKYALKTKEHSKKKSDQNNLALVAGASGIAAIGDMAPNSYKIYKKKKIMTGYRNALIRYKQGVGKPMTGGPPGNEGLVDVEEYTMDTLPSLVNNRLIPAQRENIERLFRKETGLKPNKRGLYKWKGKRQTFDDLMQRDIQIDSEAFEAEVEGEISATIANVAKGSVWTGTFAAAPWLAGKILLDHQSSNFISEHASKFIKPLGRKEKEREYKDITAAMQGGGAAVAYQAGKSGAKSVVQDEALEWVKDRMGIDTLTEEAKQKAKNFYKRLSSRGKKSAEKIVDRIKEKFDFTEEESEGLLSQQEEEKEEEEILQEGKEEEMHFVLDRDKELPSTWTENLEEKGFEILDKIPETENLEQKEFEILDEIPDLLSEVTQLLSDEEKLAALVPLI